MEKNDNDGRFPDDSRVEVRYPRTRQEEQGDRAAWPWLPGAIEQQCGPDEWQVCVMDKSVAVLRDGRRAPHGTASRNLYYPLCYRDSSEIRGPRRRCPGPACQRCASTPRRRRPCAGPLRRPCEGGGRYDREPRPARIGYGQQQPHSTAELLR